MDEQNNQISYQITDRQPEESRNSSGTMTQAQADHSREKRGEGKLTLFLLIIFILILTSCGAFLYVNNQRPDLLAKVGLKQVESLTGLGIFEKGTAPSDTNGQDKKQSAQQDGSCPTDIYTCPDGTRRSRIPPDCDFAPCPATNDDTGDTEDDGDEGSCYGPGKAITVDNIKKGDNPVCCFGLKLVLEEADRFTRGICLKCGDGICRPPEKYSNCPEDCEENAAMLSAEELARDTDRDGLFDFEETMYGTDPDLEDSDDDGYLDGSEVIGGYNPAGSGRLTEDYTTPEGTVIALEKAKADCRLDTYKERVYFSDAFFDRMGAMLFYETEDMSRDEITEELLDEFIDSRIYVNEISYITILNKQYTNEKRAGIYYEISYLPDGRDFTPDPKQSFVVLDLTDSGWMIDVGGMFLVEMTGEFDELDLAENSLTNARTSARDARRVADVKQIQTALELYYNDAGRYPDEVTMGGKFEYSGTVYMMSVPANPKGADGDCSADFEYRYTVDENGKAYTLEYCLGHNTGGIPRGYNTASPRGVYDRESVVQPEYKRCYASAGARDAQRISDIKQIQTALELYYNDTELYPSDITPGESIKRNQVTYMASIPKNPPPEADICRDLPEYSYIQKEGGKAYELRYCLEEGAGGIPAGMHQATPSGITEN